MTPKSRGKTAKKKTASVVMPSPKKPEDTIHVSDNDDLSLGQQQDPGAANETKNRITDSAQRHVFILHHHHF
jgi:hypothetical protein